MSQPNRPHKLIERTAEYEIISIEWPPGAGLDWHTHGASHASAVVIEGELTEWTREIGDPAVKMTHGVQGMFSLPPYTAHKVVNTSRKRAVSVHTYTPPLTVTYSESQEIY